MRRYIAYAFLLVAALTLVVWLVSQRVQPIIPPAINSGVVLFFVALLSVVAFIAGFKDIVELVRLFFERPAQSSEETKTGKNEVKNGSIILSSNQSGGQVAHSIVNIGTQRFEITNDSRLSLVNSLRSYTPERFDITTYLFSSDSQRFGSVMVDILNEAGWLRRRDSQISGNPPLGIIIETPSDKPSIRVLIEWFRGQNLKVRAFVRKELEVINIRFGMPR